MKKSKFTEEAIKYAVIVLGTAMYAVGFQFFLYPNAIVVGGVSGIAMIINMLTELPVGVLTIIMNIPLFVLAWRSFGSKFLMGSLVGMLLSSVFVDLLAMFSIVPTRDMLLACFIGGAIKGTGLGLVYYVGATTGGIDIVAKFARRKFPYINFGTIVLIMDCVIIIVFAAVFKKIESSMYAVIAMFVTSKAIDLVLYGIDNSNVCYIISNESQQVVKAITDQLHRGVTILEGEGAYSHQNKQVLLCVVKRPQISDIRKMVKNIDENAFFIVTDAKNVYGRGFGDIGDMN